jgi:hypothetical protein
VPTTSSNGHASARAAFCFGYDSADTQRLTILRAFPQGLRSLQPRGVRAQFTLSVLSKHAANVTAADRNQQRLLHWGGSAYAHADMVVPSSVLCRTAVAEQFSCAGFAT